MGTVVKFKPDIDYYYARGLNQYESDNFIDALKSYREAYKLVEASNADDFRSVLEVEMACCYRDLNLMRETQLMYYKALSHSSPEAAFDSIIGLIDAFGTGGNEDALKYYMDMAAKRGFSRELDFVDAATQFYAQREYKVEPTAEQNMLELGKRLLEAGQFEFARQMLEMVPEGTASYGEANSKLSALYNAAGEHEKALNCAEKAEKYCSGVESAVNTVLALYKLGRTEEYESALQELSACAVDDITGIGQIIRMAAILGRSDIIVKFGGKLSRMSPLRSPTLCYAVALANCGELREARKTMVTLQALYPYDAVVRVYARLISKLAGPSDFPLTCELPPDAEAEILEELNGVLAECGDNRNALKSKLREEDLRVGILMIFQAGSDNSKRILCDIVAEVPFFERYIRDCLMDPLFPDSDKRILLPIALKRFKKRPLYLTCRDICRPLTGKAPARISGKWKDAYYLAYSTVALFGCEGFEREFDAVFGKLLSLLGGEFDINEVALAAVIANRIRKVNPLNDDECCIELFGADKETYFKYKNMSEKKAREPKNKN